MRQGQNSKRSRGRGRKSPNQSNRSYDSNGPDVKIRGTAAHICEKYQALARDAQSSGDRVAAENYFQHAEHYYRLLMASQNQQDPAARSTAQLGYRPDGDSDWENDGDEQPDAVQPAEAAGEAGGGVGEQPQTDEEAPRRRTPRRRRPRGEVSAREGDEAAAPEEARSNGHADEAAGSEGDMSPRTAANGSGHDEMERTEMPDPDDRETVASA